MNKELKFRAWGSFNGCYSYSQQFDTLAEFFKCAQNVIDGGNEIVFEQYIGLKDKKGKEIYEDDICEFDKAVWYSPFDDDGNGSHIFVVEWGKAGWDFNGTADDFPQYIQVVGNKFENPELLLTNKPKERSNAKRSRRQAQR